MDTNTLKPGAGTQRQVSVTLRVALNGGVLAMDPEIPEDVLACTSDLPSMMELLVPTLGERLGLSPYRQISPLSLPAPQPAVPPMPHATVYPPSERVPPPVPQESMPTFMQKPSEPTLQDKIASVQRNGTRAATIGIGLALMGALAVAQFGRAMGIA